MVDIELMFFWGENFTLKQWKLPGTMRLARVGFDTWAHLWLNQCVCVCVVYSSTSILIHISAICTSTVCVPTTAPSLPGCLLASVMRVYVYSSVCLCVCVCVYGVTLMWSTCPLRPVLLLLLLLCGGYWAGTFRMTSSNGDKADRSGRLWLLLEKATPKNVCLCTFGNTFALFSYWFWNG